MTGLLHADIERIIEHAREDYARFLAAAELTVQPRRSHRRTNHLAREAGAYAAQAANDIPELVGEIEHLTTETESAHRNMVKAIRAGWHFKHLADEADCRARELAAENTALLTQVDQLRAAAAQATS